MGRFYFKPKNYILYIRGEIMLTKHVQDFLDKIGVELPEPRTMEGFGTELPLPYLERC